jgi:NMD protein affecting ribosome stability and mRNA decay
MTPQIQSQTFERVVLVEALVGIRQFCQSCEMYFTAMSWTKETEEGAEIESFRLWPDQVMKFCPHCGKPIGTPKEQEQQ